MHVSRSAIGALVSFPLLAVAFSAEVTSIPLEPGRNEGRFNLLAGEETGIDLQYAFPEDAPFELMTDQYSGNGVCVGDVDGDGHADVFLTHYNQGNRLYRNLGNWTFVDITASAGVSGGGAWCGGASFADVDNDGDLDLHVSVFNGPNLFYENDGEGNFKENARARGLAYVGPSVMMAFADYDADGDLDGYLVTHRLPLGEKAKPPRNSQEAFERGLVKVRPRENGERTAEVAPEYRDLFGIMSKGGGRIELITAGCADVLYENDGAGRFREVTASAGIRGHDIGLAATWWDSNDDGYPDLYVSNDYKGPDRFYLNQGDGTFKDVTRSALPHIPWLSMGSDFADINRDGAMDFLATDMAATTHYQQKVSMGDMEKDQWFLTLSDPRQVMRNAVYLNTGTGRFREGAFLLGLAASDWTWSPKFGDLDNDGWEDLFVTNGMSRDFMNSDLAAKIPSRWRSDRWADTPVLRQKNLAFRNVEGWRFEKVGAQWGLDALTASYGAAYGDLDRDGDLDLLVVNFDAGVSVYRNDLNTRPRMTLALRSSANNRYGIGAQVTVETERGRQVKQLSLARGFMSANEPSLHFGLGLAEQITALRVRWPGGEEERFGPFPINHHLILTEGTATSDSIAPRETAAGLYQRVRFSVMPEPHREREFDDFVRQPLLPSKHSQMGPGLAVGDVNGDGWEDVYLGGAAGETGQLLLVGPTMRVVTAPFALHAASEDMGALFFDADGDGDLDLYVVSGGVECEAESALLQDRLYHNNGKGEFTDGSSRLPRRAYSGSSVAAADFDRDGDLDLFVGSRLIPGRYPEAPPSQWLINDSGSFQDRGDSLATGMVAGVLWTDVNGDGWVDLLTAEDWGPIRYWQNDKGQLRERTEPSGLGRHAGWWRGLSSRDLDGDGDLDLVASNLGRNTKYKASSDHPLQLYYGDLDGSGERHLVEAGYEADVLYPKRGRSCSTRAMPSLGARFGTYHDFARATLGEIYGERLGNALSRKVTTLESGAFLNDGHGRFQFVPFPPVAQISQSFGILVSEINGDAFPDVYLVQNNHHPQPETGRFDGGMSQVLVGRGDGTFSPLNPQASGLVVPGDAVAVVQTDWNRDGALDFWVSQNDGPLLAFQKASVSKVRTVELLGKSVVGAKVTLSFAGGRDQTAEVPSGGGYLSQGSRKLTFGLPEEDLQPTLTIHWPDGSRTVETPNPMERVWRCVGPQS